MKKRILSLLLALVMLVGLLPTVSLAAEPTATLTIKLDLSEIPALFPEGTDFNAGACLSENRTIQNGKGPDDNTFVYDVSNVDNNLAVINKGFLPDVTVGKWIVTIGDKAPRTLAAKESQYYDDDKAQTIHLYLQSGRLIINVKKNCPTTVVTLKPVLLGSDYQYTATAVVDDASHGTATATARISTADPDACAYKIEATEKDGWTFDHWTSDPADAIPAGKEKEPSIDVAVTANTTFTAHYHEWKQPKVTVVPEEALPAGTDTSKLYTITRDEDYGGDNWSLSYNENQFPAGWAFAGWSITGSEYISNDSYFYIEPDEETGDVPNVTLHLTKARIVEFKSFLISHVGQDSVQADAALSASSTASTTPLTEGMPVMLRADYKAYGSYPDSHFAVYEGDLDTVKAAVEAEKTSELTLVASSDFKFKDKNINYVHVRKDNWTYTGKLTAVLYTENFEKLYKELSVETAPAQENFNLSYLTLPKECRTSNSGAATGTDIFGSAAFIDSETGMVDLYVAGYGGVYQLTYDGVTTMVQMAGQESFQKSGNGPLENDFARAVGGPDKEHLAALVHTKKMTSGTSWDNLYYVYTYNTEDGKWERVENSLMPSIATTEDGNTKAYNSSFIGVAPSTTDKSVLIMGPNDIWTPYSHWDGESWKPNTAVGGQEFESGFIKVNATTAYGKAGWNGTYRYTYNPETETGTWEKVDFTDAAYGTPNSGCADGRIIVTYGKNVFFYTDPSETPTAYVRPESDALGAVWTDKGGYRPGDSGNAPDVSGIYGLGGDGELYSIETFRGQTYIIRYTENGWRVVDTSAAFDTGNTSADEARPTEITKISNVAEGVTLFTGKAGALYFNSADFTVSFASNGGSDCGDFTAQVWTAVPVPTPEKSGYTFAGWFTDEACTTPWTKTVVPAKNITVYAKWTPTASVKDDYADDRAKALKQLEEALARLSRDDYSENNWALVEREYENGVYQISVAQPNPASDSEQDVNAAVNETIYAALNTAVNRMNLVPMLRIPDVQVVVSMDALTLGLGYIIKPTLVTVPKNTRASKVITDELVAALQQEFGSDKVVSALDPSGKLNEEPYRAWQMTGSIDNSFYLSQIYWPKQENAQIADYIVKAIEASGGRLDESTIESCREDAYLGEFDYYNMSGWMYSIAGTKTDKDGNNRTATSLTFPGIGAAGWGMRDGEVMRWQFTVYGYGSDLNADNSAWGNDSVTGDVGDKTLLTYKIAELREQYKTSEGSYAQGDAKLETSSIYVGVFENVLQDPLATQAELDQAVRSLDHVKQELESEEDLDSLKQGLSDKLGTIDTIDADSRERLTEARKYYDSLTKEQQELLAAAAPNLYQQLVDGEGAADTIDKINAIGEVTKDSGAAIKAARDAYDALSDAAKDLVGEDLLKKLTDAEEKYEELTKPVTPVTPVTPSKPSQKPDTGKDLPFTDVSKSSWFYDGVKYACEKGFMNGTGSNRFSPNADTTRGMIVTMLARLEGVSTAGTPWYAAGQKWAMDNGISDGTNMTGAITREQLAAILYRYVKQKGCDVSKTAALTSFTDADTVSSYAVEAMQWAVASGLIQGSGSKLSPKATASRAQVATILMRFMELYAK